MKLFTLTVLPLVLIQISVANSARILFLVPLATRSETHLFSTLAKALADKGHDIAYVSPHSANAKAKNFKEVVPVDPIDMGDFDSEETNPIRTRRQSKDKFSFFSEINFDPFIKRCHKVFNNPDFKKLLSEKFDLIIISTNFNACLLGVIYRMQVPFIYFSSMPAFPQVLSLTGLRPPSSFVPNPFLPYSDKMSFFERCGNFMFNTLFDFLTESMYADFVKIYHEHLGNDIPSPGEIERNVSMILQNSHFSLNPPRPVLPDIVEIGGMHCRNPQPLPNDLDKWLSDAKEGFIYFSLGTVAKGNTLPEETQKLFLNVFSKLKQRVLWKFESEKMPNLPSNVMLKKWLPQQDILGHKNIRLFISHGGLLSTQESTYHGVPVLGIPLIVDQDINMKQLEGLGMSRTVELLTLTEEELETTIKEMLYNSDYAEKAKKVQSLVKDRHAKPLDIAVYWTEYIIRHKGAHHLRSSARQLSNVQYFCMDVIGFLLGILLTVVYILYCITYYLCCRKKQQNHGGVHFNGNVKKMQ